MNTDAQETDFSSDQQALQPSFSTRPENRCPPSLKYKDAQATAGGSFRREYRWSKGARDMVRANVEASGRELRDLITRLEKESGNPRSACWKFARSMGIRSKRVQRRWTQTEKQRLEKLIDLQQVREIATTLRRSQSSVWHKLYRMGASAAMGRDGFTKNTLAVALHVSPVQIEGWIHQGWLRAREVQTGRIKRVIIAAEDFCEFCKAHTKDVVGNRLSKERLDFVYHFAFPPSHAALLPVRESKKERSAYEAQANEDSGEGEPDGFGPEKADDEDDAFDRIA